MKNATLQSLIARNADTITTLDAAVGHAKDRALNFKATGEISFSIQEYKVVSKLKGKLKAAHALQIDLYAEMKSNQLREQSVARLIAMGHAALVPANLTSFELAALADTLAEALPANEPEIAKAA
jgi:hypothetical protein